jgi:hypothetical protein
MGFGSGIVLWAKNIMLKFKSIQICVRKMSEDRPVKHPVKTERQFEVIVPLGIQLVNVGFWISGLSGLILGVLTLSQAAYENYYDMAILESVQGAAMVCLGAAMFIVATGLTSGARWSLDAAKRVVAIAIVWSALGISLAVYTAMNIPGVGLTTILYANVIWLIVFGIAIGILSIRYLYLEDTAVRKYAEYISAEIARPEDVRQLTNTRFVPSYSAELQTQMPVAHLRKFCSHCGAVMRDSEVICPKCGTSRDVG